MYGDKLVNPAKASAQARFTSTNPVKYNFGQILKNRNAVPVQS